MVVQALLRADGALNSHCFTAFPWDRSGPAVKLRSKRVSTKVRPFEKWRNHVRFSTLSLFFVWFALTDVRQAQPKTLSLAVPPKSSIAIRAISAPPGPVKSAYGPD
jgi:hypothetical protein